MFSRSLKIACLAALPLLSAGAAMADSIAVLTQYPTARNEQTADDVFKAQLSGQGFQDVALNRTADRIDVRGDRNGEQIMLSYDSASGKLVEVNGKPALLADTEEQAMTGHGSAGHM
ncbi:hypothetical protein [Paracoccus shanxieyensis]|uniref:PepSY domain-containing protein n=1 Tax=Paracoccus shanxieyensis TaxID=2675752 RepID=A0A6L6IX30_9RHOB|nr:hypothetical protein [Paracoccus shanxieyensis]MTH63842.1 hypothetical protein [Paracoccus shanxieyensis]MTH86646.1 hypothetical protein [Paracoccus shanxieyensis]